VQYKYLAQIYNIAPDYARDVYNGLTDPQFGFDKVEEMAETAHVWYKEKKFQPSTENKLVGKVPSMPVYNG
jgi:catalase